MIEEVVENSEVVENIEAVQNNVALEKTETTEEVENGETVEINEEVGDNREVRNHESTEKSCPLYKCNDCGFNTSTTDGLKEHKNEQHNKESLRTDEHIYLHSCISCTYKTNYYNELRDHIMEDHEPAQTHSSNAPETTTHNNCNQCEFETSDLNKMKEHLEMDHQVKNNLPTSSNTKEPENNPEKTISCGECALCFATYSDAYVHMKTHIAPKDNASKNCEICNYALSKEQYSEHMITAHGFHGVSRSDDSNNIMGNMIADFQKSMFDSMESFQQMMMSKFGELSQKQAQIDEKFINQSSNFSVCLEQMQKDFSKYNSINFITQNENRNLLTSIQEEVSKIGHSSYKNPEPTSKKPIQEPNAKKEEPIKDVKHKTLFVGSSIGHNLNFSMVEQVTNTTIRKAKAYTAIEDKVCRFPKKNFKTVVPAELLKDKFKFLFLQGGSLEISNLNTSSILKVEEYKETVKKASEDMFYVATDALKANPSLEKVVILDRIPRHDPPKADPYGLKAELSIYGNSIYRKLMAESEFKEKLVIGKHSLDYIGNMKEKIYGRENFDGIHMRGPLGFSFYTKSIVNILRNAALDHPPTVRKAQPFQPTGRKAQPFQPTGRQSKSQTEHIGQREENNGHKNVKSHAPGRTQQNYQPSGNNYNDSHPAGRNFHNRRENNKQSEADYSQQENFIHPSGRNNKSQAHDSHPAGTKQFIRGLVEKGQYTSYNVNVANRFEYLGNY